MSHNNIHKPALLNKRVSIDTRLFQRKQFARSACRTSVDNLKRFHIYLATEAPRVISGSLYSNYNVINPNSDCNTLSTETALPNELLKVSDSHKGVLRLQLYRSEAFDIDRHKHAAYMLL